MDVPYAAAGTACVHPDSWYTAAVPSGEPQPFDEALWGKGGGKGEGGVAGGYIWL